MVKSYTAHSLAEAAALRAQHSLIPYCGGTDLMVEADENAAYLFLHSVPEMKNIAADGEYLRIGAAVTFTELLERAGLSSPFDPDCLRSVCRAAVKWLEAYDLTGIQ